MRCLALVPALASTCWFGCSSSSDGPRTAEVAGSGGSDVTSAGQPAAGSGTPSGGASSPGGSAGSAQAGAESSGAAGTPGGGSSSCNGGAGPAEAPALTECPAAPAGSPPGAATALASVNLLRAHMGIPCMALVEPINGSAQQHCDYYQQNKASMACTGNAHVEVETCPGFVAANFFDRMTKAGYTGSPRSEVMAFSGDPASAVAQWINSVYHRTPLLSPWIREMGYGSSADCDTIDMGQGAKTADDVSALYPYPGQVDVPRDFDGSHEGPMPVEPPSGWPSGSPMHLYVKNFTVTSHTITLASSCEPIAHQWLPDVDHFILYPDQPLGAKTEYRVKIGGTRAGAPLSFDWTFTTAK